MTKLRDKQQESREGPVEKLSEGKEGTPPESLDHSDHHKRGKPGMTSFSTQTELHIEEAVYELWS